MKRKKRKRKFLRFTLGLIVISLLLIMLLFTPLFNIKEIRVSGANRYSTDEIKRMSGILPGENGFRKLKFSPEAILGLRLIDAEQAIESLPYVKSAQVNLIFPTGMGITVVERKPAAYLNYLGNYLTVDSDGFVLEVGVMPPEGELMEIRGIDFTQYALGKQLETSDIEQVKVSVRIIETIKKSDENSKFQLWPVVNWVDIVDLNTVLISLDNRVTMRFDPMDKLQYTIDSAKEIFFTKINTKERGRLEFAQNQNPSFIPE